MNMNIELQDLRSFVTTANVKSFRIAAELLHLSQPALTRRIQKLEETLGVILLERTTRHVDLTTVGRDFLPRAQRLLDELDTSLLSVREIAERRAGLVTIGCIPTATYYLLPKAIAVFNAEYPAIRTRILDAGANEVLKSTLNKEVDFGISMFGENNPDVVFEPLIKEEFILACRFDHPLAVQTTVTWQQTKPYHLIAVGKSSGNRLLIDLALNKYAFKPRWFYEVQHLSTSLGLIEAGLGIAALPRLALPPVDRPIIVSRPLIEPQITRTIGIIRSRGTTLSPAALRFYQVLKEVICDKTLDSQ